MSAFIGTYTPPREGFGADATPEEQAIVGRHFEYLKAAFARGEIEFVGLTDEHTPMGIAVIEAVDMPAAEAFFANDPAVAEGVFRCDVKPFRIVMDRPAP